VRGSSLTFSPSLNLSSTIEKRDMMRLAIALGFTCLFTFAAFEFDSEVSPVSLAASPGCMQCCQTGSCQAAYQDQLPGTCCGSGSCCPSEYNGQSYQCAPGGQGCVPGYAPSPPSYSPAPYSPSPSAPQSSAGSAGCPMAFNTGSVGSCMIFGCSSSRGPTHCRMGGCFCNEGFCRYPASTLHVQSRYCVQRIPGSTCHTTRVCYKGGLTTSFCEKGLCMCKWGYSLGSDGSCVASSSMSLADLGNSTEDLESLREQENLIAYNVAMFAVWVAGFVTALTAGATIVYRSLRAQPEEENGYMPFLACE